MKPSEIFREAKCVLFERDWTQGKWGQTDDASQPTCLEGACNIAAGLVATRPLEWALRGPLREAVDLPIYWDIYNWNDMPGRTFDEVIDALDRAEKIAEQTEAAS